MDAEDDLEPALSDELLGALDIGAQIARSRAGGRAPVLALAGAQGAGKSTLARGFAESRGALHLSLDDFYLTKAERETLAREEHPLFITRGPPGTHDVNLLGNVVGALSTASAATQTAIPVFDKVQDDRLPRAQWRSFKGRPDLILLEGWCLGCHPQWEAALHEPVNALERDEDRQRAWRSHINAHLAGAYHDLFVCLDAVVFLAAPSFEIVQDWRCQQEAELLGRPLNEEDRARIARFIAHYERLTRHMLAGGRRADVIVMLDEARGALAVQRGASR
jgi:D-glycerate 3-kinase